MPLFQLILQASPQSAPETLQFIAGDVPSALKFANRQTSSLLSELWCDGSRVCRFEYDEQTGAWVIADAEAKIAIDRGGTTS